MASSPTMIRGLDPVLWREIRAEAIRHQVTSGALLNAILSEWLAQHDCATEDGPLPPIEQRN